MSDHRLRDYRRRYQVRLAYWLATLVIVLLVALALSPLDTAAQQGLLVATIIILGGANIVAGRMWPIASCPSCRRELFRTFGAAQRAYRENNVSCSSCGARVGTVNR